METVINSIPKKERELVDIIRQQDVINQLYVFLLSKREETAISYAATVANSRIVDAARSTPFPVQPNRKMIVLIFSFIGLLTPVGIIWLIGIFNTTISSKDDIENHLKSPVAGEISLVDQATKIMVFNKNKSRQAEQIRTLRTNIEYMCAGSNMKVILITSGISSEGKSFLTANIGAAFAATGKKTVMLGFDLRKPGLDKMLGVDNSDGLSNYLAGQATLEQIILPTELSDNLHVITCGYLAPNPQELLMGNALPQLFDQLKEIYDCIVIDTPPIGLMSDAIILDRFADVTLYVVRQNHTHKDQIKHINELYAAKRLHNLGVVVNGIKEKKWNGYDYGYSYGTYKYYEYYENTSKKS
jgi:capsular exopolysaccharide synthesis family protein